MPLFTLFAAAGVRAYGFMQSVKSSILDTFIRSNTTGGPGVATDGTVWSATRGTMVVYSNALTTNDSVSTYPMITAEMPQEDVSVEVTATNTGQLAALWVTDSNNWWGVQTFSQAESCNCYTYYYSCNCYTYSYDCNCGSRTICGSYAGSYCLYYVTRYVCDTCSGQSCSSCPGYACSTCYPNYMRVLQSVSGSISAVYTWTLASLAAAFRVKTAGNAITMQAYSNSNLTGQIGSDTTYNATSPARTKRFGLSIGPSSYNQGTTISKISITKNP